MNTNVKDPRFYSATPDRCYRVLKLPIDVKHMIDVNSYRVDLIGNRETVFENKKDWDPMFDEWLGTIGLEVELARLFTNPPGLKYTRHVDRRNYNDQTVVINFPFNDTGTVYSWYNLHEHGQVTEKLNMNNNLVYYFNPYVCIEILKKEILHEVNQPLLINTGYIHSVDVGQTERHCFSYFIKRKNSTESLQWDYAVKIFEPYMV